MRSLWKSLALALPLTLLVAACGDTPATDGGPDDMGGGIQPNIASIQTALFTSGCALSRSCHNAEGHKAGLVLTDGMSCANLVGVPATTPGALAQGLNRVEPGDPMKSFMYLKLTAPGEDLGDFMGMDLGERMPDGSPPVDASTIAAIKAWIEAGASCN